MRSGFANIICCSYLQKMALHTMFWSIQTFCEQQIYWMLPLFCAGIDFVFTIFVCSLYRSWAPLFWLCSCTNSRLCCMHFLYHWRKIRNVLHQLTQISERQCDPCSSFGWDTTMHRCVLVCVCWLARRNYNTGLLPKIFILEVPDMAHPTKDK